MSSPQGLWGLTRGMIPTLMHSVPMSTVFFGSYDVFYNMVFYDQEGLRRPLLAGGCAGVLEWAFVFPFDTIKTRVQATNVSGVGGM